MILPPTHEVDQTGDHVELVVELVCGAWYSLVIILNYLILLMVCSTPILTQVTSAL